MGNSSSEVLGKFSGSLEKGETLDPKVLKQLFDKYDKNKNGVLEGKEVTEFLDDLYEFVYAKITPKQTKTVKYVHQSYQLAPEHHQQGCYGMNYAPQHMIPGVCTVTFVTKESREGQKEFKDNLMKDLDPNKDSKLEWDEFFKGVQKVLKDAIGKEKK